MKIFGWEHITFFLVATVLGIAAIVLVKLFCKTDRSISIAVKVWGGLCLIMIVLNRISVALMDNNWIKLIPNTFCGITSISMALVGLFAKKDAGIWHWVTNCALLGGSLTLIYPDFLEGATSIWQFNVITGFLHHTFFFFMAIMVLVTGFMRPTLKRWAWLPLGLSLMMVFGQFLISALGFKTAMYINKPLISGTIFTWYFVGFVFLAVHLIVLLVIEYVRLRKHGETLKNLYLNYKQTRKDNDIKN